MSETETNIGKLIKISKLKNETLKDQQRRLLIQKKYRIQ